MKKLIYILLSSLLFVACEKEFYLPQSGGIQTTEIQVNEIQIPENKNVELEFMWVQLIGDYQNLQGIKLEIIHNDSIVYQNFSVIESETDLFKWNIDINLEPSNYIFILKTPSGNLISEEIVDLTKAYDQDEYIVTRVQACYYLKLNWL